MMKVSEVESRVLKDMGDEMLTSDELNGKSGTVLAIALDSLNGAPGTHVQCSAIGELHTRSVKFR